MCRTIHAKGEHQTLRVSEMKVYEVLMREDVIWTYRVSAESVDDAITQVEEGGERAEMVGRDGRGFSVDYIREMSVEKGK